MIKNQQIELPFVRTLLLAGFYLVCLALVLEGIFRIEALQERLPPASVLASNRGFEYKVELLRKTVESNGPPDCFFVGSSLVNSGMIPELIEGAWSDGTASRCFNFGLPGLTASGSMELAFYLASEYKPDLIIFGTTARDYAPALKDQSSWLKENDWFRYRLGEFSMRGWLIEHSLAYRYLLSGRNWRTPEFLEETKRDLAQFRDYTASGFHATGEAASNLATTPTVEEEPGAFQALSKYEVDADELNSLDTIQAIQESGTMIVVVEMPLHPTYMSYFDNGSKDYEIFLSSLTAKLTEDGVNFIKLPEAQIVSDAGWRNRNHLNTTGASLFSNWLFNHISSSG